MRCGFGAKVAGFVFDGFADQVDAWIGLVDINFDVDLTFVVFHQDVVLGAQLFDEIGFQ